MRSEIKPGFKALQANSSPGISCEQTEYISHGLWLLREFEPCISYQLIIAQSLQKRRKIPEYTVKLLISKHTEKIEEILGY